MVSVIRILYVILWSTLVMLAIMNIPASMIPPWAIPIGAVIRSILTMEMIFVPCLANFFLSCSAYHREEYYDARNILTLLLLIGMGYTYTAFSMGTVFSICTAGSFVVFYGMWLYRDRYLERHVNAIDRLKNKKKS